MTNFRNNSWKQKTHILTLAYITRCTNITPFVNKRLCREYYMIRKTMEKQDMSELNRLYDYLSTIEHESLTLTELFGKAKLKQEEIRENNNRSQASEQYKPITLDDILNL